MKYKKSKYNSMIEEIDDGVLVFNTITTAILWIPQEMWNNEYYDGEIDEDWDTAIKCGIWVEAEKDEYSELKKAMLNSIEKSPEDIVITIVPTYACNMRCEYCFQHDRCEPIMSKVVAKLIAESSIEIISRYKAVHVTWFGGEPLLGLEVIEYLSGELIKYCDSNDIKYSADIISNGTLLNQEVAERLLKCRIFNVQITLDGIAHDSVRKMKDGSLSYGRIINNVIQNVGKFTIVLRSNVTEDNIESLKEMIDDLMVRYKLANKVFFSFFPVSNFEGKSSKGCDFHPFCSLSVYSECLADLVKHVLKYQDLTSITNFLFRSSTIPCEVVCRDNVCFDAYGDVYKCGLSMQNTNMAIGNLLHTNINEILNNGDQNGWLSFQWDENCKDCNFLPMCHSGCIYQKRASGKSRICAIDQTTHRDLVKLVYQQIGG